MKNFKPGQKVVFSTKDVPPGWVLRPYPELIAPNEGDILTIVCLSRRGRPYWLVDEFRTASNGREQIFHDMLLFPIEEIHAEETDKIISSIEKFIEKSHPLKPQLI